MRYLPEWFPGAGFKRKAFAARKIIQELLDTPYEMVKRAMVIIATLIVFRLLTRMSGRWCGTPVLHHVPAGRDPSGGDPQKGR